VALASQFSQSSSFNFNFPEFFQAVLVVFQKNGIIGELRPQSQAALQWNLAIGLDQKFLCANGTGKGNAGGGIAIHPLTPVGHGNILAA